MSDRPGRDDCNCNPGGGPAAEASAAGEAVAKVVKANVPQDAQASFNLRIVPGRGLKGALEVQPNCKPRGHSHGWTPGILGVDSALLGTLAKADKTMVAWLAKDAGNARRFLANPVAAMREAGVELSRADEKALARAGEATAAARSVAPGVDVVSVAVQAFPNGRVGAVGPRKPDGKQDGKPDGKVDDFGCGPKRKG